MTSHFTVLLSPRSTSSPPHTAPTHLPPVQLPLTMLCRDFELAWRTGANIAQMQRYSGVSFWRPVAPPGGGKYARYYMYIFQVFWWSRSALLRDQRLAPDGYSKLG